MPVDRAPTMLAGTCPRPGTVSWPDLATPDVEAASRSCGSLLGRSFADSDTPGGPCRIARVRGRGVGGLMSPDPTGPPSPRAWTVSVEVVSPDAVAAAAPAAGASVLQEQLGGVVDQPPVNLPDGRLAVVEDPQGAVFGLFAPQPGAG